MEQEVKLLGKTPYVSGGSGQTVVRLNMIVKNEGATIKETIRSCKDQINSVVILDTGSTDGTPNLILEVCEEMKLECIVYQTPFVNYSVSRNKAIELAEPGADWLLLLSGDEYLRSNIHLPRPSKLPYSVAGIWANVSFSQRTKYKSMRIVTTDGSWRYKGVTHECIGSSDPKVQLIDYSHVLTIDHNKRPQDAAKEVERFRRDVRLLYEEWNQRTSNPDSDWEHEKARTCFYLAQSYDCLGEKFPAIDWYTHRILLGGWVEEVYESQIRIGRLNEYPGIDYKTWMEKCFRNYIDAYSTIARSVEQRAEPLNAIASTLNNFSRWAEAYPYAYTALSIAFPTKSRLFVDPFAYDYERYINFSVSAYYLGDEERKLGYETILKLDKKIPNDQKVKDIIAFYATKMS